MEKYRAFTLKASGIMRMLKTDALVLPKATKENNNTTPKMWRGLWDTGASASSINKAVVEDLGLIPIGKTTISTANGVVPVDTYLVDIGLPNGVMVTNVMVSCADLGKDIDVLIGMDIIRHGDFAITNKNHQTTFSFRIPSVQEFDFVKESQKKEKEENNKTTTKKQN